MRRPIILTGPPTTPEATARLYGISKKRAKQLKEMVEKSLARRTYSSIYFDSSSASKNGAETNKIRVFKLKAKNRGRAKAKAQSKAQTRTNARRKVVRTR